MQVKGALCTNDVGAATLNEGRFQFRLLNYLFRIVNSVVDAKRRGDLRAGGWSEYRRGGGEYRKGSRRVDPIVNFTLG